MESKFRKSVRIKALLLALIFSMSIVLPVAATAVELYDTYTSAATSTADMELTIPEAPEVPDAEDDATAGEEDAVTDTDDIATAEEDIAAGEEDVVTSVRNVPAAEEDVVAYEEIDPMGANDYLPWDTEFRFDIYIGSLAAFHNNTLAPTHSVYVTIPAGDWGTDLCSYLRSFIPAEILVQLPTVGYAPIRFIGFGSGSVDIVNFIVQPLNNLSLTINFRVDDPDWVTVEPEGFDPNPFLVDGFTAGDIVTLEMALGFIYERTGFDGIGFGTPELWCYSEAANYTASNYTTISATGWNWATVYFPLLEETPQPPPVPPTPCEECEKYPCECKEEVPEAPPERPAPRETVTVTRRAAAGPKTGDSNNYFMQIAAMAVVVITIAGTGLVRTREQS